MIPDQTVDLGVKRTDSGGEPYWQHFDVPVLETSMSVLDCLIWAQQNSDASLAFRCACRVGMCGTCGIRINGREGLACRTLIRTLTDGDRPAQITVEPMNHLPVVRDLVTDMTPLHAKIADATAENSSGIRLADFVKISPGSRERRAIDPQRECIYCGLCYSACSVAGLDEDFLGPAALNRAFVAVADSRSESSDVILQKVATERGLWHCHTLFECTAVCPKDISPALAVQQMKRKVFRLRLRRLLRLDENGSRS